MLCIKCGQEYEGSQCPRCEGPVILVNNSDYLARKKAYEEKQALKEKSASSDKKNIFDKVIEKAKTESKKKDNQEQGEILKATTTKKKSLKTRKIVVGVLIAVVALVGIFGVYKLVTRKNYTLYMSYNNKIYNMSGTDSEYVCDYDKAVFTTDGKTFYAPQWPDELDNKKIISSLASPSGNYYASVLFEESKEIYKLYVWSSNDCVVASEDTFAKNILSINDDGAVVFTSSEILDDQGSHGRNALFIGKNKGDKKQISMECSPVESDIKKATVYLSEDTIVCLNKEDKLFTYNYKDMKKSDINTDVDNLVTMYEEEYGVFSYKSGYVNDLEDATAFVYNSQGNAYYYDIDKDKTIKLGKELATAEYIYDSKNKLFMRVSNNGVEIAKLSGDTATDYEKLDSIDKDKNFIYIDDEKKLIYINEDNELCFVYKGDKKRLEGDVQPGSLSKVYNKSGAFTYIAFDNQYYREGTAKKAVEIYSNIDKKNTENTCYYKDRIYMYSQKGVLYSNNLKGKDFNEIGKVDHIWIGTELK